MLPPGLSVPWASLDSQGWEGVMHVKTNALPRLPVTVTVGAGPSASCGQCCGPAQQPSASASLSL